MGVRESINRHKAWAVSGSVLALAGAVAWGIINQPPPDAGPSHMAWYTSDDGRTWFKDTDRRVPPFEHGGATAVLAHVYRCGDRPFVAWMERYDPEGKDVLDAYRAAEDAGRSPSGGSLMGIQVHVEYKRPGEERWTPASDGGAVTSMMLVSCPNGDGAGPNGRDAFVVWP
jgi:hypothetical protein